MKNQQVTKAEIKKLLPNRLLYVRNGDIRFLITKASFFKSTGHINSKMLFTIEVDERKILLEYTLQLQNRLATKI